MPYLFDGFFKYLAIVSCLLICLFAFSHSRRKVAQIQALVFCFTLGADFFLLFTDYFAAGVFVFLGAHICALIRYRQKWLIPVCVAAAVLFGAAMLIFTRFLHAGTGSALTAALCFAYGTLIVSVTISTFHARQPRENALFSRLGMLLFIICDLNVMIFNSFPQETVLYTLSTVLMWAFYLPAQTLLALSATDLPLIHAKRSVVQSPGER